MDNIFLPIKISCQINRRKFLKIGLTTGGALAGCLGLYNFFHVKESKTETFIASAKDYNSDLKQIILQGFKGLGITSAAINGKNILLKPNLVEPHKEYSHINTSAELIRAVAECFSHLGAANAVVAEGAGHQRDSYLVLEESGLSDTLYEDKIPYIDLNTDSLIRVKNSGNRSNLGDLYLPEAIVHADYIVSVAKMKTHHWTGVTLSMKNLFGVMPGSIYGWPKNVLHQAGLLESIYDINATLKPHLAIVDGIVGMEGDGPIMGDPVKSGVIVIGKNLTAVDATCARVMGINPEKVSCLKMASGQLGPIREANIIQRGENISSVRRDYRLLDRIPAHRNIRLNKLS